PPRSPSTTVISHSGRAGSKAVVALTRATLMTAFASPGGGAVTHRRCQSRSTSDVRVQRGGASRSGGTCTTWCIPGIIRLARSTSARSASRSGAWSRKPTATTVERSSGSRSMYQLKASEGCMCASLVTALVATMAPPSLDPDADDARAGARDPVGTNDTNLPPHDPARTKHQRPDVTCCHFQIDPQLDNTQRDDALESARLGGSHLWHIGWRPIRGALWAARWRLSFWLRRFWSGSSRVPRTRTPHCRPASPTRWCCRD